MKKETPEEHIKRIIKPVFDKVLQEKNFDSMTIPRQILWRPNNYRRQMRVKTRSNSAISSIKDFFSSKEVVNFKCDSAISSAKFSFSSKTYRDSAISSAKFSFSSKTLLIFVRNYRGVTIMLGKNFLTGIYSQRVVDGCKETFLIKGDSVDAINSRINEKKILIRNMIDRAINDFAKRFGLKIPYERIVWSRHEDWIKGDDYIDNIPRQCIIHDTVMKKVYDEGLEFIGGKGVEPTVRVKNYIKNRALEDFCPVIVSELNRIYGVLFLRSVVPVWAKHDPLSYILDNAVNLAGWFNGLCDADKREVLGLR